MKEKVTLGIIGAGRIGQLHAENILYRVRNAKLKSISDLYVDRIQDWANEHSIPHVTNDYQEILNDPEIDAVLICSSTDTHAEISIEAANKGKHVFCEKPIDFDVERIDNVLAAVKAAGIKYQVGFNRRFDHNFKKVAELIQSGKIGELQLIKITSRDPAPPPLEYIKVSGGMLLDMTIHDFDMVRYLSQSEVEEVHVVGTSLVDPAIGEAGDIDTAITTLKLTNRALCVIDNSRKASYGYDQRVEVFGSKGKITVGNETPTTIEVSTEENVTSDKPQYFFLERYNDSFVTELKDFVEAILLDIQPPVSGIDGLKAVEVGLAARKSLTEGKRVAVNREEILTPVR
jgi:myo-inositol 2-dehydrogenase / D-chiro-inositol 1-dehydrogenase